MITITGAGGKTGRALVAALSAREVAVRALVRQTEGSVQMEALGASETVVGDLTSSRSLVRALDGSHLVYHICPNMRQDEVEIGKRVIDACRQVGTERIVYHSVLHPQIEAMPHHWKKLRVEEQLLESGLRFTVLQPAAYMQNLKAQLRAEGDGWALQIPYARATRLGMIDLRDLAEVAALVLTEGGHSEAIYELCGPQVLDQSEIGATLARSLGAKVTVEVVERRRWAAKARSSGLGEYAIDALLCMFEHYERHGFAGSARIVESILGKPPARLEQVSRRWVVD